MHRSLIPDADAPAAARRALETLPQVDEELLERGSLVVTELVTNSVRHAGLPPAERIELRASAGAERLRLEVTDAGDGFEPAVAKPDPGQPGGSWGLWIVAQVADRWGVDTSHSTRVWCEFDRPLP